MEGVEFKVDMESEALKAIQRFIGWNTQATMENLTIGELGNVKQQCFRTYMKAWGGMQPIDNPRTIYQIIKKVLFETAPEIDLLPEGTTVEKQLGAVRGSLTGSTWKSIESRYTKNTAEAGLLRGSWPSELGRTELRMADILDYMSEISNIKIRAAMGVQDILTYRMKVAEAGVTFRGFEENVVVSFDASGFRIQWPEAVKKMLRLKDMEIPSEPFETKEYGVGGAKTIERTKLLGSKTKTPQPKDLFWIDETFAREVMQVVEEAVDQLMTLPTQKAIPSSPFGMLQ